MAQLFTNAKEFFTAGENLSANEAVYVSDGTGNDTGRTAGRVYKLDVTNEDRRKFVGFVAEAISSGETATVISLGRLKGFSGLTAGQILYASLSAPGEYQTVAPIVGQFSLTLGLAKNADTVLINASLGSDGELLQAGGGVGGVDFLDVDTFNEVNLGDYDVTGTVTLDDVDPIQGAKSIKLSHATAASFKKTVAVDSKFNNKNVTLSVDLNTDADSGNLTLTVRDETNAVDLIVSELMQPQAANQTSVKRSVSFVVPETCASLSYKFDALSDSGKVSFIDNVVIELTQTAKMSTTIEVPKKEYALLKTVGTFSNSAGVDTLVPFTSISSSSGLYSIAANGTSIQYNGSYLIKLKGETGANSELVTFKIEVNGVKTSGLTQHLVDSNAAGSNSHFEDSFILDLKSGDVIKAYILNPNVRTNRSFELHIEQINSDQESQEVSLAQAVLKQESDSEFTARGFVGNGSTNTGVIRMSGNILGYGDALTYLSDAVNGDSWTVTKAGVYHVHASVDTSGGSAYHYYFTKNASVLTATSAATHPLSSIISNTGYVNTAHDVTTVSGSTYCNVGDIIRFHCNTSGVSASNGFYDIVKIAYQGSLKQVNVTENQKIEIPTSELRMEGASTRGTGAETRTVRFQNIAKLRGGAFEIDNSNATIITMKKKGRLNIDTTMGLSAINQGMWITKNQLVNTANPLQSETLASTQNYTATANNSLSCTVDVEVGDKIRVNTDNNVTSGNNFSLSFQEQEIAVSVTNVLPQFSESDSSVRVDTANGYGSTNTNIRRFSNIRDNIGSDISYVDSATLGGSFTVLSDGLYNISYTENFTGVFIFGITKNASGTVQLSTLLGTSAVLASSVTPANSVSATTSCQAYLLAGDVIRAHTQGEPASANNRTHFTISKVGKPNVTGVDVTPFAKIEYEVTEQLSASAGSSAGSGTALISNFSSLSNSGSILQQSSSRLTATVDCEVSISWTWLADSVASNTVTVSLYKNGALYGQGGNANNQTYVTSAASTALLRAGDYLELYKVGTVAGCSSVRYNVTVTDIRNAYQVIGGGVENTYSARIANNGTATITSQSYPFISSVVRNSVGNVTINFIPGFFTVAPSVIAQYSIAGAGAGDRAAWVVGAITTTSVTIGTEFAGTTLTDTPFEIIVQRQGSDYRTPSKAIGLPQQRIAYLYENIASGAASGSIVASTWTNRRLDQILDSTGLVTSLASNQFTLPVGKYSIDVSGVMYFAGNVVFRLRNITDSTTSFVTSNAFSGGSTVAAPVYGSFEVTLTSPKTFAVQYFADGTGGAGVAYAGQISSGESTRPTLVKIVKVEE